jgi:3',5'-cyclic AMP phosphodiesterase CpdA
MVRVLVVSDSHLSPLAPHADDHWTAIVAEAGRSRPDLVVHAGDISMDGANDAGELRHARCRLDELPVPWRAIPGNHDIGDVGDTTEPIDEHRRAAYAAAFGEGSWDMRLGGWHLVGVDIQTLASPLPAATGLWSWLNRTVTGDQPTALFIHRPLLPHQRGESDEPRRYVTGSTRRQLLDLVARGDIRLVVSGHVHQWRDVMNGACRHVWAPSTWSSLPDAIQPRIGTKVTGAVDIELDETPTVRLVRPEGVADLTGDVDFRSPYGSHD